MLVKKVVIDSIEVLETGHIQVRTATLILDDGKEIGKTYHRHVIAPDQDTSKEDPKVQAIANIIHTKEVIDTYKATQDNAAL